MSRSPKSLTDGERALAEVAARAIVTTEDLGLPDAPHKIVTSEAALRALARDYLELRGQAAIPQPPLHERLWQRLRDLRFSGRTQNMLTNAGLTYVGELVQADRATLLRFKNFGKSSLREIEAKLAELSLIFGSGLDNWPGPRWACFAEYPYLRKIGPQIVSDAVMPAWARPGLSSAAVRDAIIAEVGMMADARTPQMQAAYDQAVAREVAAANPLVALYCRIMGDLPATFAAHQSYVVRQWDGMDGCWTDCTGEVDRDHALHFWSDRTGGGQHHISYAEIDYYRIFPGGTHMLWDGSDGQEMHR